MKNQLKTHPLILLILFFITIIPILVNSSSSYCLGLLFIHVSLCLINRISIKNLLLIFFSTLLFSSSILLLNYFYAKGPWLNIGLTSFMRAFLISFISLTASMIIDFEKLLLFLMSKKVLSPSKGYPIFAAINALPALKEEKKRLNHLTRMRGLDGFKYKFRQILPLLVFAIRHSQRAATAMVARGLNDKKIFYYDYSIKKSDYLFGFIVLTMQIVALLFL